MKKTILIFLFLFGFPFLIVGQTVPWNYVNNYSFETHNTCEYYLNSIDTNQNVQNLLPYWFSASVLGTPDYFNTCYIPNAGSNYYGVPNNLFAFQYPKTGNAFGAIYATQSAMVGEAREYLQTQLKHPLKANKKYCVGMYANLASDINIIDFDKKASKDIGILLSQARPFNAGSTGVSTDYTIVRSPQVTPNTYITDTLNWAQVSNIVTAQGGEKWLTIGVFKPFMQGDLITVFDATGTDAYVSYYFIDDVYVVPMEYEEALVHKDTSVCAGGFPITIRANDGFTGYTWNDGSTNNTLTVNTAGTYTVAATYAGCTIIDTIHVKMGEVPSLAIPDYNICDHTLPLQVTIPTDKVDDFDAFAWSNNTNGTSTILQNAGIYTVTATMECGSTSTYFTVTTAPEPPDFSLGNDTSLCVNAKAQPIVLGANLSLSNYQWSTGAVTPSITVRDAGIYTLSVTNACGTKTDAITIKGCDPAYYIPNIFSPNGDGKNDGFTVYSNETVTQIQSMKVFDRLGECVFAIENIPPNDEQKGWDGMFRGQDAASDVYVYMLTLRFADGSTEKITGDVTVIR